MSTASHDQPQTSPEIGLSIEVDGVATNYHDVGSGDPVLLIHGSGPGVSGWANWRLTIPELAKQFRVIAPDILGFGYTERTADVEYGAEAWLAHLQSKVHEMAVAETAVNCTCSPVADTGCRSNTPAASTPWSKRSYRGDSRT